MSDRKLTKVVAGLFIAAMIMGPGPGLRLINPDPSDPNAVYTFCLLYTSDAADE